MKMASASLLCFLMGVSLIVAENSTSSEAAEATTTYANDSTSSETPSTPAGVAGTTSDTQILTANATTPARGCRDGQDPIVDETSCFILCPKGAVFYDSAGPKADGESCVIRVYIEGTNTLKAEYPGTCNGLGRCIRVTTLAAEPESATTKNETGTSEAPIVENTTPGTTPRP